MERLPVAVLGATGMVGQKFIVLLENHPFFEVKELVASPRSAGQPFGKVCRWKQERPLSSEIGNMIVKSTEEELKSKILFSGLDSSVAGPVEEKFAHAGHLVISNSKNHRMDEDVPLIIPEINPDHLELIKKQPYTGAIITNSNCSTMFLAMTLAPLHRKFGVDAVNVTTMQAVSGAGYPGVASLDILGNIIPYIKDEEEKLETETQKILGTYTEKGVIPADIKISAQCHRVPVYDGHTETLSIKFSNVPSIEDVRNTLAEFRGLPQELKLPSAPDNPIVVLDEEDRPQPLRDVWTNRGMSLCVGRIRECPVFDVKMIILGHNTVRGAAGASILNAETLVKTGYYSTDFHNWIYSVLYSREDSLKR
ncbi:MAG: aspartate-semialdehyde dehydrogenase [Spirochaetes bacterium]|nr:MAG: aspartate-semialdehyde dehydrogenase [Spirochaetota bacterium]